MMAVRLTNLFLTARSPLGTRGTFSEETQGRRGSGGPGRSRDYAGGSPGMRAKGAARGPRPEEGRDSTEPRRDTWEGFVGGSRGVGWGRDWGLASVKGEALCRGHYSTGDT
jgi:hypothetical protein